MTPETAWGLTAGITSAVLFGLAAVVQAHAARRLQATHRLTDFVRWGVRDPLLVAVVVAYLVGFVLHAVAIWWLPLYLAQATVALSLPVTALASGRVDGRLPRDAWRGVAAVTVGLVLLARAAGEPGDVRADWWLPGLLLALLLGLVAVFGPLPASRGALLGWGAGFGYAGSALAVRGIGWPLDTPMIGAALLVPAFGLVAFWLYSRGLAGGLVTTATAPMITSQTFVPALVGLALLGDGTRSGWLPVVALGLVLAVVGAATVRPAAAAPPVQAS